MEYFAGFSTIILEKLIIFGIHLLIGWEKGCNLILSVFTSSLDVGDIPENLLNIDCGFMDLKFKIISFWAEL
jgi:hypothetical protein